MFPAKHVNRYLLQIFTILPVSFLTATPVYADSGKSGSLKTIRFMVEDILTMGSNNGVAEILSGDVVARYGDVWVQVQGLAGGAMTTLAYSVLSLTFIVGIVNMGLTFDNLTTEALARPFIGYAAALVFVRETPGIMSAVLATGSRFAGMIQDIAGGADISGKTAEIMAAVRPSVTGFFSGFVIILQLALPWIASWIIGLLIRVIAYGVIIETFIRAVLLPLSYGDLVIHGLHGHGFRFLKQFAAVCLQGGIMLLVSYISGRFCVDWYIGTSGVGEFIKGVSTMLVAELACAFLMLRSGQICREMLGA